MQKALLLSLIGLIFCGSVGVSVFAHLCSVDGAEISYFHPIKESCKPQAEEQTDCCHQEPPTKENNVRLQAEKCCREVVSYYKISTENADKILKLKLQSKHHNVFFLFPEIFPTVYDKEYQIAYESPDPPGKSSGREILITHQVFRI